MDNAAIDTTARIATFHRADVARQVAEARAARCTRQPAGPVVTDVPSPRRSVWSRWIPAPHPAH